jgi:putative tryptophan/tyrosine transport system substrate-binding protein
MNRRDLMALLGSVGVASPFAGRTQQKPMPVIGYLSSTTNTLTLPAFLRGLAETGDVEGQNVVIEYRSAEGHYEELPALAADLVGRKVDVIATSGGASSALAAKNATSTIPIVFLAADPVRVGLVAALARPGGNLTGFSVLSGAEREAAGAAVAGDAPGQRVCTACEPEQSKCRAHHRRRA